MRIGDDHAQWRAYGSNSEIRLADDDVAKIKLEKFKFLLLTSLLVYCIVLLFQTSLSKFLVDAMNR